MKVLIRGSKDKNYVEIFLFLIFKNRTKQIEIVSLLEYTYDYRTKKNRRIFKETTSRLRFSLDPRRC
jgi:hypothetical protein